jgi:hypothetical protein
MITHGNREFTTTLLQGFNHTTVIGRVQFLEMLFKIMRWMSALMGPQSSFHLKPGIRIRTPNGHHVCWIKEGLIKEYNRKTMDNRQLNLIDHVYSHSPALLHVESGRVVNHSKRECLITRLGHKLSSSTMARAHLSKDDLIQQVQNGLDELHSLGLAHCDLSLNNVFIDDAGVVFLDDLEYLSPLNDPPAIVNPNRLPHGTVGASVKTAVELDNLQFQRFKSDVWNLL